MARKVLTFVGIDWDFFIYNGFHDRIRAKNLAGEWGMIPGLLLFDWGMSEGHPDVLQYILWKTRMEDFDRRGLRIEDVASIRPDLGCAHPLKFVEEVEKRFNFAKCPTLYSDSHAHGHEAAYLSAVRNIGEMDLLLFDAHHDLGYCARSVEKESEQRVMSCGSWAFHTLVSGLFRNVRVVYPDWRGTKEWPRIDKESHLRGVRDRLTCTTWSEWCEETKKHKRVFAGGLHFARSSSWTPPYMDRAFSQLVERLGSRPKICMDCDPEFPRIGAWDACKQRTWFR